MGFYERRVLPRLLDFAMSNRELRPYRDRVVGAASGEIVEIGVGSGLNLPLYDPARARRIAALDPSRPLLAMALRRREEAPVPVELVEASAEALPFASGRFDTAVVTWALCTIGDPVRALAELRRVLKPGGRLLFVEHGRAPDPGVARWQARLTPLWRRCAGGCHLDRPVEELVRGAGFRLETLATGYMNALKPFTFMYEGAALN